MIRNMYQYLDKEKLHYLAELCDEEGVLGEDFFDSTEEFLEHVKENNIEYVGEIDAELMLTELLTKNIKIEYDKELGEGAYDEMIRLVDEKNLKLIKKLYNERD
tara:strand:- start:4347 stop:4658 length:312 start_codon:yes stop_codon:yes gene_type:complete